MAAVSSVLVRFTYEVAPVFTLMEDIVLERMRSVIGWPAGTGDGIFAPGLIYHLCFTKNGIKQYT